MGLYYNGKKVRNLYYNGKCLTRLALGKEMTRLVEGDDFVRAKWLCGRNGAYINTNYKLVTIEDRFECFIKYDGNPVNPNNREQWIFGVWNNNDVIGNYIARADNKLGVLYKVDNQLWCRCTENYIHKFETFVNGSSFYCIDNGLQFSDSTNGLTEKTINSPCYLYTCNGLDAAQYFHGDIAYFNIEPTKVRMFPCRLLRPIPATLDANGIARSAGECGMYDSISGKFYGNVGSGTFTVSND